VLRLGFVASFNAATSYSNTHKNYKINLCKNKTTDSAQHNKNNQNEGKSHKLLTVS
jgi:hypothetical protein